MVVMRIGGLAIATVVAVLIVFAGCGGSGGVKSAQESSPSASSTTTGVAPSPTWVPTSPLPSVTGLDALITFLADHGVVCDHVDVENEDATALPTGPEIIAMCYRPHGENTLELLIYRSAHDRTSNRPGTTLLPCSRSPEASARDMVVEVDHPTAGVVSLVATPLKFGGTPAAAISGYRAR